jgi:hypothetical protein
MKILSHNRWREQHFEWVKNYALCFQTVYFPAAEYENNKLYLLIILLKIP